MSASSSSSSHTVSSPLWSFTGPGDTTCCLSNQEYSKQVVSVCFPDDTSEHYYVTKCEKLKNHDALTDSLQKNALALKSSDKAKKLVKEKFSNKFPIFIVQAFSLKKKISHIQQPLPTEAHFPLNPKKSSCIVPPLHGLSKLSLNSSKQGSYKSPTSPPSKTLQSPTSNSPKAFQSPNAKSAKTLQSPRPTTPRTPKTPTSDDYRGDVEDNTKS